MLLRYCSSNAFHNTRRILAPGAVCADVGVASLCMSQCEYRHGVNRLPLLLVLALAACPGGGTRARTTGGGGKGGGSGGSVVSGHSPRLVVLLIIDQLPEWHFETRRPLLTQGFGRLLAEGEWRVGRHESIATATSPGHALLGTGEPPARSGIISNDIWSREEQRLVGAAIGRDDKPSAERLRVPGLGDSIAAAKSGAKAIGVSLKVRSARLPLGHHGLAIYYDAKLGAWQTHGAPAPAWFTTYTHDHPIQLAPWNPRDAVQLATLTGTVDDQKGEVGEKGFGPTFPHDPASTKSPNDALLAMPLGNDLTLDMATAAIAGENLGADDTPDLLVVSLSAHDYIAHGWGHESWEALDGEQRLDERLDLFLTSLDTQIGKDNWSLILTSDHGGPPLPERTHGGRFSEEQIQRAANAAFSTVLGNGNWVASASWPNVTLTPAALAQNKKELANAYKKIIFALRSFPGVIQADRSDAFIGNCDARPTAAREICLALDPERAGEFFYIPRENWIVENEDERLATGHGSPYDYDRNVPVILLPFGRTAHDPQTAPSVEMNLGDVAPLIASWLGVSSPRDLPR